jgi:hypothetical protein
MRKLYPPLDDSNTSCNNITSDNNQEMKKNDDVLSPELRHNFEEMKALKRKESPSREMDQEHETKKLQLAIKTAVAAENEIARLRNGIAELEALLVEQGGDQSDLTVFPFLPPVVPADDDGYDDDDDDSFESNSSEATGERVHG